MLYDVIIIGAGVTGSAIARELSKYEIKVCVIEKEEDVCCGTTKANSAIVHAGFDAKEGSLMAELNVKGNQMMEKLAEDLDIPFIKNGSLVVCTDSNTIGDLEKLYERGIKNGVKELRIIEQDELRKMEKNISDIAIKALYAPTAGIICPFELNLAMAENAYDNGVEFLFNTKVEDIKKCENYFDIKTNTKNYQAKCVVNAAGVYGDEIHNMVGKERQKIIPRRGDYFLLDKTCGNHVTKTIFALPTKKGKGILVTPTVHGNLLIGPTAIDMEDKEATNTTSDGFSQILEKSSLTVKDIPMRQVITSFAGIRAHDERHEFIIGELEEAKGFVDCTGIESPGLTSAPAIGEKVCGIVVNILSPQKKSNFISKRKGVFNPSKLSLEERNELIKTNNKYGNIICRCESVSEGEILDAIRRPLGAKSLDGIKRRVRAGSGRCQGGFCSPRIIDILSEELNIKKESITKHGGNSTIILGKNKDRI